MEYPSLLPRVQVCGPEDDTDISAHRHLNLVVYPLGKLYENKVARGINVESCRSIGSDTDLPDHLSQSIFIDRFSGIPLDSFQTSSMVAPFET